ncbi:MAG: hypothetical protein ABI488_18860 [Polyangiaceae bacterium]
MTSKKPSADESARPESQVPSQALDVALIHGVTPDGEGLQILRARENRLELGALRPLREGAPITGEVVTLRPRPNAPALCDVEVHVKAPEAAPTDDRQVPRAALAHPGPAQVATDEYRRNWDSIWSRPADKSKLVN